MHTVHKKTKRNTIFIKVAKIITFKKDNETNGYVAAKEKYAAISGASVYWLSMRTHNDGAMSLIPPCVTIKTPLVRKATGNHLVNSTSLEKTQSPVSSFCYAQNRACDAAACHYIAFCLNRFMIQIS